MILETAQLLNNALFTNSAGYLPLYKPTHLNHPASLWTRQSTKNFDWLLSLGRNLCDEYTFRYNKIHASRDIIERMAKSVNLLPVSADMTPFVLCMPEMFKSSDPVNSYRTYYKEAKVNIAKWNKGRSAPNWW